VFVPGCVDARTKQKERRMKIMKTRRSSTAHSDDVAAQKVLKVIEKGEMLVGQVDGLTLVSLSVHV